MAVKMEGPLTKWTNVVQGWQYRWFVLDEYTGLLSYYTSKDKMIRGARRGCLRLKGGKVGISDEDDCTFTLTCDHRTFHFQAQNADERLKWVSCLEEVISNHMPGKLIGTSAALAIPTEEELNHRLQEAEAYFRILTQQIKTLEAQINHSSSAKSERAMMLKDSLTQMIETMGRTIELLHDAKTSLAKKVPVPILSSKSAPNTPNLTVKNKLVENTNIRTDFSNSDSGSSSARSLVSGSSTSRSFKSDDTSEGLGGSKIEVACEEIESGTVVGETIIVGDLDNKTNENENEAFVNIVHHIESPITSIVPINTYTSSDDDMDEFFDANEQLGEITIEEIEQSLKEEEANLFKTKLNSNNIIDLNAVEKNDIIHKQSFKETEGISISSEKKHGKIEDEYDNEDNVEEESGDNMQQHGSVITHLLSQVRIGMDLTKVTLPTFILERRSLLEMYADFFAHPDLFKGVPDLQDPGDRMLQVLKWYLSSFHAGRKGSVAKKPYNPILGEILQCFYNLTPDENIRNQTDQMSTEGPIPWCTKDDVSFIAEQVSHHPPISAFYAECEKKRICFNSHLWTKSKFLGLSIGVHIVGTGNVYVSDFDEEYIMTFPNGYGRSILTVPWVELGGKTEITCPKSGYSVQLDFLTKPFYGGKRNRITADVYAPDQKKPFLSVNGEWNGVMYAKYADQKEAVVFVDTFNMPTVTKKVKRLDLQEEFESRRLWKDVTHYLKNNMIEEATEEKHKLEEKQRQDARVRKETNTKWVTRLFDEWAEGEDRYFFYKWPLFTRLGMKKPGC